MSTPALIYLALTILGVGIILSKHGQPETGKYSFPRSFFSMCICWGLLYWGGFFDKVAQVSGIRESAAHLSAQS